MKGTQLGEFEELVLLVVAVLHGQGYGINICEEIERHTGRRPSVSTVHTTLNRLEKKGFIRSRTGPAEPVRGGRSKRLYTIQGAGQKALEQVRRQRERLWSLIPNKSLGYE